MTDERLPQTAEQIREFMDNLTFTDPPTEQEAADLLAALPPKGSPVMVVRSLRLPVETDEAVVAAARSAGLSKTTWIRQAIDMALAVQADEDEPISRADAIRALSLLRPAHRAA
jgi:predicted DNA-binding protein